MKILRLPQIADPIQVPASVVPEYDNLVAVGNTLAAERDRLAAEGRSLDSLDPSDDRSDPADVGVRVTANERDLIALFVGAARHAKALYRFTDAALTGWFRDVLAAEGSKMSALLSRINAAAEKRSGRSQNSDERQEIEQANKVLKPYEDLKTQLQELRGSAGQAVREGPEKFATYLRERNSPLEYLK